MPKDLIKPSCAARYLSVHIATIYRWIQTGRLRSYRVGQSRYLLARADVMALVEPVEPACPVVNPAVEKRSRERETQQTLREYGIA